MRAPSPGGADLLEFVRRQRAGFTQDVIGDANLADVVEQRAQTDDVDLGLAERELAPMSTDSALTRSEWPAV